MDKILEYRKHAAMCRTCAAPAPDHRDRDILLMMALAWDNLAKDVETDSALKQQVSELDRITQ
jgi:hypothetical protein